MKKTKTTGKATKVRKRAPSKITDLRKQLDIIDGWLCQPGSGEKLANVLSALRGPDCNDPGGYRKRVTTEVIRTKAFPQLRANGASTVWNMAHPATRFDYAAAEGVSTHFESHVYRAATVLGLL